MKRIFPFILIIFSLPISHPALFGQNGEMPDLRGWVDDAHYLLAKTSMDGESQLFKVDAKTGKESPYEWEEDIADQLPEGLQATRRNSTFTKDRDEVIIRRENDLYYFSTAQGRLRQLTANPQEEKNPQFSPDGKHVAFTRSHNLYVLDIESGLEHQLTFDGSDVIYNGWASWVYYEEILGRASRYRAFYWSPDSKKIAFLRFDDSPVPAFPIFHHIDGDGVHGEWEITRYPKSGDPNPKVSLGIVHLDSSQTVWVDTDKSLEYTAWIFWTPDSGQLLFQQMNRDQNLLKLFKTDPATGKRSLVYEESQPTWVEFFPEIDFLKNGEDFLLRSNRDGWYNLYLYGLDGKLKSKVTDVNWRVNKINWIDENKKRVFFEGTGENPTERQLFVVNFNGENFKQLSHRSGTHSMELSPEGTYFIDEFSSFENPGLASLFDSSGKLIRELGHSTSDPNKEKGFKVEFFTVPTSDGFKLPAYWVLPSDFDESKKYPVIFSIYGGPDAGTVFNRYRNFTWNPIYGKGVIRFTVDHRASGKFGKKGLDYMYRNLGKWEMNDYIEAVKWLRQRPFIDSTRIGIEGGSYGGYMTAMALTYAADYFTQGVAHSSVTDWRLYDDIYTERYMDTPEDNPEGYQFGSVMTHAAKLKGKLLLIHGTIDDNVHLQNTILLVSELEDLGKDFELMLYPGGRHGWGGQKGRHSFNLSQKFWERYFFGQANSP